MNKSVSIIREKKEGENRVILGPKQVGLFKKAGFKVFVEENAGVKVGYSNEEYVKNGGTMVNTREAWGASELVFKYKPPSEEEFKFLNKQKTICAVFHAEGNPILIKQLLESHCTAYSYEFFRTAEGYFPLSVASSEIAGKIAVIYGAYHLQTHLGGSGVLLASVINARPVKVLIIGHGNAGGAAARLAAQIGAEVTVLGRNRERLRAFQSTMPANTRCLINNKTTLEEEVLQADLVIGAILISTYDTPAMISEELVKKMKNGSMIIDVTAGYSSGYLPTFDKETTFSHPTYKKHGIIHCKIDVLPQAYATTTVEAMSEHLAPYLIELAEDYYDKKANKTALEGKIVENGKIIHPEVKRHFKFYRDENY